MSKFARSHARLQTAGLVFAGIILGTIVACVSLLKLKLIPSQNEATPMTYADLSALILAAVALFVGVLLPLFGAFGYILAKHEAVAKSQETVSNEMKNGGMLHKHVEEAIAKELKDEGGTLKLFIDAIVKKEVSRRLLLKQQRIPADDWGNEADEYGEYSNKGGGAQ